LSNGPTLVSDIEWEHYGGKWTIGELKPSKALPRGAEKVEVWRSEDYGLKAKLSGTIEGEMIDLHPPVELGSLIPLFEIEGSDHTPNAPGERSRVSICRRRISRSSRTT
jgi:hypothetical protein